MAFLPIIPYMFLFSRQSAKNVSKLRSQKYCLFYFRILVPPQTHFGAPPPDAFWCTLKCCNWDASSSAPPRDGIDKRSLNSKGYRRISQQITHIFLKQRGGIALLWCNIAFICALLLHCLTTCKRQRYLKTVNLAKSPQCMHANGRKQALCKVNICNDLTSPTTWPECTLLNGKVTQMPYSLSTPGQFQLKSSRSVLLAVVCWLFDRSSSCKQLDGMYNTSLRWVWKRACRQGRTEVSWLSGQEISLTSQCSSLRSFRSKFTVLKKVLVTLLGLFDAFPVIRRPGHLPPRYAPACKIYAII